MPLLGPESLVSPFARLTHPPHTGAIDFPLYFIFFPLANFISRLKFHSQDAIPQRQNRSLFLPHAGTAQHCIAARGREKDAGGVNNAALHTLLGQTTETGRGTKEGGPVRCLSDEKF